MVKINSADRALHIECGSCGAENRIPIGRVQDGPRCGRCGTGLTVDRPITAADATLPTLVAEAQVPVLVDFWAPWCGPCRMIAPELEKVARQRARKVIVAKLNSDENPATSARYGIQAIPTMLVFRGGSVASRLTGAMGAPQILRELGL